MLFMIACGERFQFINASKRHGIGALWIIINTICGVYVPLFTYFFFVVFVCFFVYLIHRFWLYSGCYCFNTQHEPKIWKRATDSIIFANCAISIKYTFYNHPKICRFFRVMSPLQLLRFQTHCSYQRTYVCCVQLLASFCWNSVVFKNK